MRMPPGGGHARGGAGPKTAHFWRNRVQTTIAELHRLRRREAGLSRPANRAADRCPNRMRPPTLRRKARLLQTVCRNKKLWRKRLSSHRSCCKLLVSTIKRTSTLPGWAPPKWPCVGARNCLGLQCRCVGRAGGACAVPMGGRSAHTMTLD